MYHVLVTQTVYQPGAVRWYRNRDRRPPRILFSSTDADDCYVYVQNLSASPVSDPDAALVGKPFLSTPDWTYWLVDDSKADRQGQTAPMSGPRILYEWDNPNRWAECHG